MKVIKLKVTPHSSFISFPKGDMLFGHFASTLFLQGDERLKDYLHHKPQIILSDFLPDGYLPKPTLPLESFSVNESDKKDFQKKRWTSIENLQNGQLDRYENLTFYETNTVIRNSINRNTFSTNSTDESGFFAPYGIQELVFLKMPVVYVMFDESFQAEEIVDIFNSIGKNGFGKKSSIGKGQFSVEQDSDFQGFLQLDTQYYLTLSPTFLHNQNIKNCYYDTFNRFGKYANVNTPFKKPVLMADSASVVMLEEKRDYIGQGVNNGTNTPSFVQGYSILVPFKFDGKGL